ncbi:MAG TPA: L,D-transpeptidase, partial [Firmicutes bacterium]|nr:L,D-transpeptidase [Bacillota bacterium]
MAKKRLLRSVLLVVVLGLGTKLAWAHQIVINIPAFTLYLYENGIPQKTYPIAIGTELNPSVLGETAIINKVVDPTYYPAEDKEPIPPGPDNPVGSRWLGLGFSGYGIHGTNNPASIGKAASLGCIRMLNRDVEELFELVKIGTPVHLIYQTVVLQEDPLLHTKTITVYPDVYKQGTSASQLENGLARLGWDRIFRPALEAELQKAAGRPNCVPASLSLRLNESRLASAAIRLGDNFYLPCDSLNAAQFTNARQWGDYWFVPLEAYLNQTGLGHSLNGDEIALKSPKAFLGDTLLGRAL